MSSPPEPGYIAWGYNGDGELGVGNTTVNYRTPQAIAGLSRLVAVTAGGLGGGALSADGTVYDWGGNANGQLGNGTRTASTSPVRVTGINDVVAISAQNLVMHAIRADGTLWGWGNSGDVGDASLPDDALTPDHVGLSALQTLPVGGTAYHLIVTRADNSTDAWGDNSTGAYGNGTTTTSGDPVALSLTVQGPAPALTQKPATRASYDADGNRRSTASPTAGTTTYTWDQSGPIPLLLGETTTVGTTRHVYGPGGLPVETIDSDGTSRYDHHDQLGSTRLLTGANGNALGSLGYDAYGTPDTTGTPISPRLGYAGQYTDPTTGLQNDHARYYDPTTGQFLNRDPIGALTRDPYGYAGRDPLDAVDPSGLSKCGAPSSVWDLVGSAVDCVAKADHVVRHAAKDAASTATLGADAMAWASTYPIQGVVNFVDAHVGANATVCVIRCISVALSNGDFYIGTGQGAIGFSGGIQYYSHPTSQWCSKTNQFGLGEGRTLSWDASNPWNYAVDTPLGLSLFYGEAHMRYARL